MFGLWGGRKLGMSATAEEHRSQAGELQLEITNPKVLFEPFRTLQKEQRLDFVTVCCVRSGFHMIDK